MKIVHLLANFNSLKIIGLVILESLLGGCGFIPSHANQLPSHFNRIYYQGIQNYDDFNLAVIKRLRSYKVTLLPQPAPGVPTLNLTYEYHPNIEESLTSTRARIYIINYSTILTIGDYQGQIWLGPLTLKVSRQITLQPNEVFEVTPQITIVKYELQQELLDRIVHILVAPNTTAILQKHLGYADQS